MKILTTLLFSICLLSLNAQKYWTDVALPNTKSVDGVTYEKDRTLQLAWQTLADELKAAPMEFSIPTKNSTATITLPMPYGEDLSFHIVESPVMMEKLANRYPQIKSYKAVAATDERITARFDIAPNRFHAVIRTPNGKVYIDPLASNPNHYRSFYVKDTKLSADVQSSIQCGANDDDMIEIMDAMEAIENKPSVAKSSRASIDLRTYRLAISCTGEYGQAKGGTVEDVLASFVTSTNRLNEIFEIDLGIRFLLIDEIEKVIFLDGITDPFPNPRGGAQILGQNTQVLNNNVGSNNYDIGHAFTIGCDDTGGIASLATVCGQGKGAATTCHRSSNVAFVAGSIFAHEVGHQFAATHSWQSCPGSQDNRSDVTAYEPGSGSTVMSYAGVCSAENIESSNDLYFHVASLEQAIRFSRAANGDNCPVMISVGNEEPIVSLDYESGFQIPISTPFELVAQATDANDNNLTYCWEQFDRIFQQTNLGTPAGNAPLFR
ncbi:MAG: reprolysin-like metallopeptidase, partial [Bacteroidota bacterium]